MLRTQTRTPQQQALANDLAQAHNIDPERVLFLRDDKPLEPWLPPEALITIARQSDKFKHLDEGFQEYIAPLNQVVHHATFIDADGNTFGRSGVATIKEGDAVEVDAHVIAAGRAISAALTSGGINPLRPGSVIPNGRPSVVEAAAAESRRVDLARIHKLAKDKGLIVVEVPGAKADATGYRAFVARHFPESKGTAAGFNDVARKSLIDLLDQYVPDEFSEIEVAEGAPV